MFVLFSLTTRKPEKLHYTTLRQHALWMEIVTISFTYYHGSFNNNALMSGRTNVHTLTQGVPRRVFRF